MAQYADHYFEYDAREEVDNEPNPYYRSVTKEVSQTDCSSCSGSGGGSGTDAFTRTENPNYPAEPTDPYNTWKTKTELSLADGHKVIVYTNKFSQPILRVFEDNSTNPVGKWREFFRYDDSGRLLLSASTYDRVELKYNRQGQVTERKDQAGTVHAYDYDGLGRLTQDRVTAFGSVVDNAAKRIARTYEVRGMLKKVTTYDHATPGSGTVLNEVEFAYNDFGQLTHDYQEHDGAKDGNTLFSQYSYADGSDATEVVRLEKLTFPNGRELHYLYAEAGDTNGIGHVLGRVTALASATTRGDSDANVIAGYEYMGMGTVVRKDYPTPDVRLDYWGGTTGTYTGFDRFGRIVEQRWHDYASGGDVFKITHGYDRASNRLYANNDRYRSASQVYTYDNLHRLTQYKAGKINANQDDIASYWTGAQQNWNLDPLGNHTDVDENGVSDYFAHTANKANEYTQREIRGDKAKAPVGSDSFGADTSSNWTKPGSGDAFDVNSTNTGKLTVTTISQDTIDTIQEPESQAILFLGEATGPVQASVDVSFPAGTNVGQAGFVFGYKDGSDYWLKVIKKWEIGSGQYATDDAVYHVVNGTKTEVDSDMAWGSSALLQINARQSTGPAPSYEFASSSGYPSGKYGLYTNVDEVQFDDFKVYRDGEILDMAGRWANHSLDYNGSVYHHINFSSDKLEFYDGGANFTYVASKPVLLKGLRVTRFEATFSVTSAINGGNCWFLFNATDQDDYDGVLIDWSASAPFSVSAIKVVDGQEAQSVSGAYTSGNYPTLAAGDKLWVRVSFDGTTLSVKGRKSTSAPTETDWSNTSAYYSATTFDSVGGQIGFMGYAALVELDDLTVKADRDANGSYETTDHVERFTLDGSGYAPQGPEYDPAGNMTFDGEHQFTYDAWNRLVKVAKAYKEGTDDSGGVSLGSLQAGSVVSEAEFDGLGRRIVKQVKNSAWLDCTYHYYYDPNGHSVIEERNGSDQLIRQLVWGQTYIDELIQIGMNDDPSDGGEQNAESFYWAMQDANFNVLGVIDSTGALIERYEYTPYGERTVFFSSGSNDPDCYAPTQLSRRWKTAGGGTTVAGSSAQAWGLCEIGRQGLTHEEESSLIHNRARALQPGISRFMQRDPYGIHQQINAWDTTISGIRDVDVVVQENGNARPLYFIEYSLHKAVEDSIAQIVAALPIGPGIQYETFVLDQAIERQIRIVESSAAKQYVDGMNIYQYLYTSPLTNHDPSGMLVNLFCGCQASAPLPPLSWFWRPGQIRLTTDLGTCSPHTTSFLNLCACRGSFCTETVAWRSYPGIWPGTFGVGRVYTLRTPCP